VVGVEKGSYREISKTPQAAFPWERRTAAKRLVKTPKVYFADVGTLCYLAGLKTVFLEDIRRGRGRPGSGNGGETVPH
jgi:predicted AAA+ superfamily ATPase